MALRDPEGIGMTQSEIGLLYCLPQLSIQIHLHPPIDLDHGTPHPQSQLLQESPSLLELQNPTMNTDMPNNETAILPLPQRELRSSSLPRLREASKRAKYGSPTPPTDAFIHDHTPAHCSVEPGKPTTSLTPKQRFQIAQSSVLPLIGKRVNRNNQRTEERDPWNHYGAGSRWAKMDVRGRNVDTKTGVQLWREKEGDEEEPGRIEDHWDRDEGLFMGEKGCDFEGLSSGLEAAETKLGDVARWKDVKPKTSSIKKDWEFVDQTSANGREDDIDWDIISICSVPG